MKIIRKIYNNSKMSKNLYKLFFYGTLKQNEPNHHHLLNRNVEFLSEATTVDKWPLIIATDYNIPYLVNKKGHGYNVKGEIYLVDQESKDFLDDFERVKDNLYSVVKIDVKDTKNEIHYVDAYILSNYKQDLLNDRILLESYSSINPYYNHYVPKKDRSVQDTNYLIKQLKG